MWKKFAVVVLASALVVGLATPVRADPGESPPLKGLDGFLDDYVSEAMREQDVPGAAVTVVANGQTVYENGFGYADVESKTPVDLARTGFLIGSETKLFTAQAVLQLADKGDLDLDTDVNEYLTTFDIADTFPGEPVTLRHLLTHTAGFDDDHLIGSGSLDPEEIKPLGEAVADTQPQRLRPPGTAVTYSNYGVALAGYVVEEVSGRSYDEYIDEEVFAPLGMDDSTVTTPHPDKTTKNLATGYTPSGGRNIPVKLKYANSNASGAGPVSTSDDMTRYLKAFLDKDSRLGPGVAEQMLKQQYTEDPSLTGMGFQWEQNVYKGHSFWFKGGDFPGFHSFAFLLPEQDIAIHVMSNGDGAEGDGVEGFGLLEEFIDRYLPKHDPPKPGRLSEAGTADFEGWYQSSKISDNSFYKVKALTNDPIHVTAAKDGIVTTGFFDGEVAWDQVAPGEFQRRDGWDRIVFTKSGNLAISNSTTVFEPLTLAENPYLHIGLLLFGLAAALVGFCWLPVTALVRRVRKATPHSRPARIARVVAWASSALVVAAVGLFAGMADSQYALMVAVITGTPLLTTVLVSASLTVVTALVQAVFAVVAWRRGWWRLRGRIAYSLLTIGIGCFAAFATTYNMVGPPFT